MNIMFYYYAEWLVFGFSPISSGKIGRIVSPSIKFRDILWYILSWTVKVKKNKCLTYLKNIWKIASFFFCFKTIEFWVSVFLCI